MLGESPGDGGEREAEATPAPPEDAADQAATRARPAVPVGDPDDARIEGAAGGVRASACACGGGDDCSCDAQPVVSQQVFALGQLNVDLGSEAQRDSIVQHMDGDGHDPERLLAYLDEHPWEADAIAWTLNLEATPIYAVRPYGPFAEEGYRRLRRFLREQRGGEVERISVGGSVAGHVQLSSGQVVPIIVPRLRCLYSWSTAALVESVLGKAPAKNASATDKEAFETRRRGVRNFLERVYHELRNLGATPRERALNYAATNALNAERIFEAALKEELQLDTVEVERSPICRPGSQCWEVKLTFFHPRRQLEQARRVYRFTVDVSEACPVMVGAVRSWYVR